MDILVTPSSLEDFDKYQEATIFLVGNKDFCEGYSYSFSIQEIINAVEITKKLKKKIYININKIFQEFEINKLKDFFAFVISLNIDGIVYTDMAVYQIAKEFGKINLLVYASQTQIVNKYDAKFYLDLGIKEVLISKECNLDMVKDIVEYLPDKTIFFAHGYMQIFYSRRKLLENYALEYNLNPKDYIEQFDMRASEFTRNKIFPIYQDENGSIIYSDYILCSIKYLQEIINKGLKTIWLDGIFMPLDYQLDVLKIYSRLINKQEVDIASFFNKYSNLPHSDEVLLKEDTII